MKKDEPNEHVLIKKNENTDATWDNRKLDEHIKESFELKDKDSTWEGKTVEATSDPLIDEGKGRGVVLRRYSFAKNPQLPKGFIPTRQDIFNQHAKQIKLSAWAEGLEPREDLTPHVEYTMTGYNIIVWLQKHQQTLGYHDVKKYKTLQEVLKK